MESEFKFVLINGERITEPIFGVTSPSGGKSVLENMAQEWRYHFRNWTSSYKAGA